MQSTFEAKLCHTCKSAIVSIICITKEIAQLQRWYRHASTNYNLAILTTIHLQSHGLFN
jgi:hypothetical protein